MYKQDLALNNIKGLIGHKTQPTYLRLAPEHRHHCSKLFFYSIKKDCELSVY